MNKCQNSKDKKREIIIKFIKQNSKATYQDIRKATGLHPERLFSSLKDAFIEAKVNPPRSFECKTKEERRKRLINYIKKNPLAGGQTISKETKINIRAVFSNIQELFNVAGVKYPRRIDNRTKEEKKKEIIDIIKKDPLVTIPEIISKVKTQPYKIFNNFSEAYKQAGVKEISGFDKRTIKKQREVIKFIQQNPLSTQREINKFCKTHVQELFDKGIFEAYEKAGIKFPYERLRLYGIGLKEIRNRAKTFEDQISVKLSGYGNVNRLVKTKRGFADVIFERNGKKAVIEIKDYQNKEISISQINQLNRYLEDCQCNLGFLICKFKPKKDKFLIGKSKIYVLEESELEKIPKLIGSVV